MIAYPMLAFKMCQLDISQQDLANMIGMKRATLHMKLSGRNKFKEYEKFKIAQALKCTDMDRFILFANREESKSLETAIKVNIHYRTFLPFMIEAAKLVEQKKGVKADDIAETTT